MRGVLELVVFSCLSEETYDDMGLDMIEMGLFFDMSGDLESPGIGIVGVSSSAEEYRESSEMLLEIGEEHLK